MAWIESLQLTNFRSYGSVALDGLPSGPVVLYGSNGAGKTNVLEALSFLSPGRGLRGAKVLEVQRKTPHPGPLPPGEGGTRTLVREGEGASWAVAAQVQTPYGAIRLGTGRDPQSERRIVRINGEPAKSQAAMAEYMSCVWLTPQMDRLFLDGAGARRRFLDRLVFTFDPGHAGRLTRYDNALSQRAKILREHKNPDPSWLQALEATMAETGIAITAARADFIRRLQAASRRAESAGDPLFPHASLTIAGTVDELLRNAPALEVEELFKYQLRQTRAQDALNGGAATGPHRSDFLVRFTAKDMPASQCSTGEQKALLIGIVLAHARLVAAERGAPPVLLLDEVAAHLDETRRKGLFALLLELGGQVWMTGTDSSLFFHIAEKSRLFEVRDSEIFPAARRDAA
jgi:DNA replication and repair protein RecF